MVKMHVHGHSHTTFVFFPPKGFPHEDHFLLILRASVLVRSDFKRSAQGRRH